MRFVLAALSRPVTVVVALVALALFALLAVQRMPVDIFPKVGEPAIYVAQPYGGMDPAQMEGYLTYYYEYHFLYITGINRVESKSIQGAALMKLVFHEGTDMAQAAGETVGYVNRARAFMPPGTVPPGGQMMQVAYALPPTCRGALCPSLRRLLLPLLPTRSCGPSSWG